LWGVKRVVLGIRGVWKGGVRGGGGVFRGVERGWKGVRTGCAEMIHFLCQLQYYILFEVSFPTPILEMFGVCWLGRGLW